MYIFSKQLRIGKKGEGMLDDHFSKWYEIEPATRKQERRGIDRIFTRRSNGRRYAIEYKCDKTAAQTGNAFVETVSVDSAGKPGWALTCSADFIIYYIVGRGPAYVIRPKEIKRRVKRWGRQYPKRAIPNKKNGQRYNTIGLLVPLFEFERIAYDVLAM